ALHGDGATEPLDDPLHDPQPQAEACVLAFGSRALEALEDALLVLRRDPDALIRLPQVRFAALFRDLNLHRLAGGILDGVGGEVRDHLLQPAAVPLPDDGLLN